VVQKGDVLVALYGANSGEVALSKIEGAINQAILCLRHETNNAFVYIIYPKKRTGLYLLIYRVDKGIFLVRLLNLLNFIFQIQQTPQGLIEQQKIADCLSSLDELITPGPESRNPQSS